MRILLFIVFAFCHHSLLGQNGFVLWKNGGYHSLGAFHQRYLIEASSQKKHYNSAGGYIPLIIQDTFVFENTGTEDLIINKIHVRKPDRFTFTKRTKPKHLGYIYFSDTINPYQSENIELVQVNINVMTNYSPWNDIKLEYIVLRHAYVQNGNNIHVEHPEGKQYLKLQNGRLPKCMGIVGANNQKLYTWKYWDDKGMPLPDTTWSKLITIAYFNDDYNNPINADISAFAHGQYYKPIIKNALQVCSLHVKEGTDTVILKCNKGKVLIAYPYQQIGSQMHFYNLEFLQPLDAFYWDFGQQKKMVYSNVYVFAFKKDWRPDEQLINDLETRYPNFEFAKQRHYQNNYWAVRFPKGNAYNDSFYLKLLKKENGIDKISQCLMPRNDKTELGNYGFLGFGMYTTFYPGCNADSINRVLQKYGFTKGSADMAGLTEIIYNGRFIGPEFLKLYNQMLREKVFMNLRLQLFTEWIYSRGIELPEENIKR
jgi:hypothetical protein